MSRFSYFSHIENLTTGHLVLTDPFQTPKEEGQVCRYELHRSGPDTIKPDENQQGIMRWRRLLPISRDHQLPQEPFFDLTQQNSSHDFGSLHQLTYQPWLPLRLAETLANQSPDLEPWGNPYRAESIKLLGLEIFERFPDETPVVVMIDPTGELIWSLQLAVQIYHSYFPERTPLRPVLVQKRPNHQLCQAFEGSSPDWTSTIRRPPDPAVMLITAFLGANLGTAIAIDENDTSEAALTLLERTRFADDEDHVILLG